MNIFKVRAFSSLNMDYTRDDVTRIIGAYAIALQERRLQFSGPQRSVLEEVLLRELCGLEDIKIYVRTLGIVTIHVGTKPCG